MKTIPLSQGLHAKVSNEDYNLLVSRKWCAAKHGKRATYAVRHEPTGDKQKSRQKTIYMHREIVGSSADGLVIDHINGDGLDNQRENLRVCTVEQNLQNSHKHRAGKPVGVSFSKTTGKYRAQKWASNDKLVVIGLYATEEEASSAYSEFIKTI